jgi:hypothetical protein
MTSSRYPSSQRLPVFSQRIHEGRTSVIPGPAIDGRAADRENGRVRSSARSVGDGYIGNARKSSRHIGRLITIGLVAFRAWL